jgi:hypothetical protein
MIPNKISATLSEKDKEAILNAIETIRNKMPFLISLSSDDIKSLMRMGTQSKDFVDKALEIAKQNEEILPRAFDVNEMSKDVVLYRDLGAIRIALMQLMEQLESTYVLVGSEAFAAGRLIYNQIKTTGNNEGLVSAADEMKKRFRKDKKASKKGLKATSE